MTRLWFSVFIISSLGDLRDEVLDLRSLFDDLKFDIYLTIFQTYITALINKENFLLMDMSLGS